MEGVYYIKLMIRHVGLHHLHPGFEEVCGEPEIYVALKT
jgi:hypothetical protein